MSAKHTPGPWEAQGAWVGKRDSGWSVEANGDNEIAFCFNTAERPDAEVDARLIAAAPELLEAAKLAVLNFKRNDAGGQFLGDDDHEAWTALDRAIAKAEGA